MKTNLVCGFCILTLSLTLMAEDRTGPGSLPGPVQPGDQIASADSTGDSVSDDLIGADTQGFIAADDDENPGKAKGKGKGKAKGHDKDKDKDKDKSDGDTDSDDPASKPAQPAAQEAQPPAATPTAPASQPAAPAPVPAQPQPAQTKEQAPRAPASTSVNAPARKPAEVKKELDGRLARLNILDNNAALSKVGLAAVARETGVPESTLQAQRRSQPVATGGLLIANEMAKATGKSAVSFIKFRRQSREWDRIAADNKFDLTPVLPKLERVEQAMKDAQSKSKK